ncbi:hypothetical protein ILYODFUR_016615 [Ilyodon furcidens]|uniref:Uncharacterized protein n=1 Tax=Ilyodon furcidens TaxID=33524 RepID=A0ABV0USS1_9TELE
MLFLWLWVPTVEFLKGPFSGPFLFNISRIPLAQIMGYYNIYRTYDDDLIFLCHRSTILHYSNCVQTIHEWVRQNFNNQTKPITKSSIHHLKIITRRKGFLSNQETEQVYDFFKRLDHCNSVLTGLRTTTSS